MTFGNTYNMMGPMMEGAWYNPKTKDSFVVRDCFFQDDDLFVTTRDGRTLSGHQIKDYVQQHTDVPKSELGQGEYIEKEKLVYEEDNILNRPISSLKTNQKQDLTRDLDKTNINTSIQKESPLEPIYEGNSDDLILDKIFNGTQFDIETSFKWSLDKKTKSNIKILTDNFNIQEELITKYILKRILTKEFNENISKQLEEFINKKVWNK